MRRRHITAREARIRRHPAGLLFAVACVLLLAPQLGRAQKGMGDPTGVARQGLQPPLARLSGKILSIETHPCEKTTGRAVAGTHLIAEGVDGQQYNIHVGPADAVASIVESLEPGRRIEVVAFRTSKLPENQYVATSLVLGDGTAVALRDANLRPFWSRRGRLPMDRSYRFAGSGRGWGIGRHSRGRSAQGSGPWRRSSRRSGRCLY